MDSLLEIEAAIERLPEKQVFRLAKKLEERTNELWDSQFEQDVMSGKLDDIAAQVLAEEQAGKTLPFPPNE
jgi:hypothetical protein